MKKLAYIAVSALGFGLLAGMAGQFLGLDFWLFAVAGAAGTVGYGMGSHDG